MRRNLLFAIAFFTSSEWRYLSIWIKKQEKKAEMQHVYKWISNKHEIRHHRQERKKERKKEREKETRTYPLLDTIT